MSVRDVLDKRVPGLISAQTTSLEKQGEYAEAVAEAYANGTRTSIPSASDGVLDPMRRWRKRARSTYADLKDLEKGTTGRALAMQTFAQLDNALYHQVRSLKKGTADRAAEAEKAKEFFSDYNANYKKLRKRPL